MAILQSQLSTMTREQLEAIVMAANKPRKLTLKVGAAGGVSVYGMGKWPVTLYRGQWERLLDSADEIRSFILANADSLSTKA